MRNKTKEGTRERKKKKLNKKKTTKKKTFTDNFLKE